MGKSPEGLRLKFEYLGRCEFQKDCGQPAIARVWGKGDRSDKVLVCRKHFDQLRGILVELQDEETLQSDLTCVQCRQANARIVVKAAGPHYRANCESCGAFLKFLGKREWCRFRDLSGMTF